MCLETGTRIPADVLEFTEQLPVLRDETRSIGGLHNILGHLHSESFQLERDGQGARERADIIAYVLSNFQRRSPSAKAECTWADTHPSSNSTGSCCSI